MARKHTSVEGPPAATAWQEMLGGDPVPWLLSSDEPAARWVTLTAVLDQALTSVCRTGLPAYGCRDRTARHSLPTCSPTWVYGRVTSPDRGAARRHAGQSGVSSGIQFPSARRLGQIGGECSRAAATASVAELCEDSRRPCDMTCQAAVRHRCGQSLVANRKNVTAVGPVEQLLRPRCGDLLGSRLHDRPARCRCRTRQARR
jgi:hypothetical protein